MKKYSKLTYFVALIAALVTTACSDDFGSKEIPQEELYTRAFIKEFGIFDANHTWCAATPTQITINPQSLISDVKVYSRTDGKYYYVAHYTDVYKTTTITFDAPRGTTDLKIIADGTTYYAQAGTTLSLSGSSRTVYSGNTDFIVSASTDDPFEFYASRMVPILATKPYTVTYIDGNTYTSASLLAQGKIGQDKGIIPERDTSNRYSSTIQLDFNFVGTGDYMTIYPMYWNTNQQHILGIYYYPNNDTTQDMVMVDIYQDNDYGSDCQLLYQTEVTTQYLNKAVNSSTYSNASEFEQKIYDTIKKYDDGTYTVTDYLCPDLLSAAWSDLETLFTSYGRTLVDDSNNYLKYWTQYDYDFKLAYTEGSPTLTPMLNSQSVNNAYATPYDYIASGSEDEGTAVYSTKVYGSQGIKIFTPKGIKFGMYLKLDKSQYYTGDIYNKDYRIVYSQTSLHLNYTEGFANSTLGKSSKTDVEWAEYIQSKEYVQKTSYACTFTHPISGNVYFSFEDAFETSGEDDLNDLVFMVQGVSEEEIEYYGKEETPYEWLICAEDLGTTDDFDFNDMIVGVNALTEGTGTDAYTTVKFKAMAAGGTLPIKLYFDPSKLSTVKTSTDITSDGYLHPTLRTGEKDTDYIEFHKWFDSGYESSKMINTGAGADVNGCKGRSCTIYVDGTFSLSSVDATSNITTMASVTNNSLASFSILVEDEKSSRVIHPKLKADIDEDNVSAPQMFVIPRFWYSDTDTEKENKIYFNWPTERTNILDAYNGTISFKKWVENQTTGALWYQQEPTGSVCIY